MNIPRTIAPAALFAGLLALAPAARAQDAEPTGTDAAITPEGGNPARDEVRRRSAQGEAFFDAGNYEAAAAEFQRVYEILPPGSERYLLWYNIGQCYERLFRFGDAADAYGRYLEEAGDRATDRAEVEHTIQTLQRLLGTLTVRSNVPDGEVWIDGRRAGTLAGPVRVPGGHHTVQVRAPGYEPGVAEVEIASGVQTTLRIDVARHYQGISPTFFYAGAVATALTLVGSAVTGSLALVYSNEFRARGDANLQSEAQTVNGLALTTDVLLVATGVLAAGTAVLYVVGDFRGGNSSPHARRRRRNPPRPGFAVGPGGAAITLGVTF